MNYEWDESKRIANTVKHNVDFLDAERFDWSSAIETIDNRTDYKEERWIALGFIDNRLHVLIYSLTLQESRVPQICGVKGEAAPPGRGRRTLDNPARIGGAGTGNAGWACEIPPRRDILGFPIG